MAINHPSVDQLDLPNILTALGDATRLVMISRIAGDHEVSCGQLEGLGSPETTPPHAGRRDLMIG